MAQSISQEAIGATGLPGATAASRHAGATTSGAPTTGTFAVGDYVVDQTGAMYVCTVAGTAGTWQLSGVSVNETIAGKNFVINGGMDIAQRGTSVSVGATTLTYTLDRWCSYTTSPTVTVSQISSGLTGFQYAIRTQRNSGQGAGTIYQSQSLETKNSIPLAGQTVTVSFWARAGANYSQTGNGLFVGLGWNTTTDGNILNGGFTQPISTTQTITTSWVRYSYTTTIPSNATQVGFYVTETAVGTAGANDYFDITGVQLEIAPQATPFSRAGGSIGGELLLCQRYFQHYGNGSASEYYGVGSNITTSYGMVSLPLKVKMRATPSVTYSAASTFQIVAGSGGSYVVPTSLNVGAITADTLLTQLNYSSLTTGAGNFLQDYGYGTSSVNVSAEL